MPEARTYEAVVIGVSAGGLAALKTILPQLDKDFPLPVLIVQHLRPDADSYLHNHLNLLSRVAVKEAEDKELPRAGTVYIAPPDYHLLVEPEKSLALSADERVNFSRPSVDVLFETAAEAYQDRLIGVVLTGGSSDGARGLAKVKQFGGLAIVQSPETAEADTMPRSALEAADTDHILPLNEIGPALNALAAGHAL